MIRRAGKVRPHLVHQADYATRLPGEATTGTYGKALASPQELVLLPKLPKFRSSISSIITVNFHHLRITNTKFIHH